MTDWVETYFPTNPPRTKSRGAALRRVLTAAVFTTVIAGSLFVSLARAPLNQTAFGGAFPGIDLARALDLNSIEPASGVGEPDRMGKEKAAPQQGPQQQPPDFIQGAQSSSTTQSGDHQVQAVLVARNIAVISSTLDARITKMPLRDGDMFEKGDVIAEFDCGGEVARLREVQARQRLSKTQLDAYNQLKALDVVSKIEVVTALENNAQALAQIEQLRNRISLCKITAPFAGRVVKKTASQYEFVQTGRVLMEIASREPLQAQFLIPSIWLRWLNVGTPVEVYIAETDRRYPAKISRIHGEVDPVSQSLQVDAELDSYSEVLLPGMSGRATFAPEAVFKKPGFGFLGLMVDSPPDTSVTP